MTWSPQIVARTTAGRRVLQELQHSVSERPSTGLARLPAGYDRAPSHVGRPSGSPIGGRQARRLSGRIRVDRPDREQLATLPTNVSPVHQATNSRVQRVIFDSLQSVLGHENRAGRDPFFLNSRQQILGETRAAKRRTAGRRPPDARRATLNELDRSQDLVTLAYKLLPLGIKVREAALDGLKLRSGLHKKFIDIRHRTPRDNGPNRTGNGRK